MDLILDICNCALFIRSQENIRVRQPLSQITLIIKGGDNLRVFEDIIKDEINIKSIVYRDNLENFAVRRLLINFQLVGKRLSNKIKDIITASKKGEWQLQGEQLEIAGEVINSVEFSIVLEPKGDIKGAKALSDNFGLIMLDLEITKELEEEGVARDLIRFIQQARKDDGFNVSDRIKLKIKGTLRIIEISKTYEQLITEQTLSKFGSINVATYECSVKLMNKKVKLALKVS